MLPWILRVSIQLRCVVGGGGGASKVRVQKTVSQGNMGFHRQLGKSCQKLRPVYRGYAAPV